MRAAQRLALVLVAAVGAGCLSPHDVLTDQAWRLAEVHGAPPVAEGGVSFGSDGEFTVHTGCNIVGGTYHLEGNRILVDTSHQTLVLCEGELAVQEAGVLGVVRNRPAYAIETGSGRLRLTSDADQVLVFEAP